jgi:hypothetical protein
VRRTCCAFLKRPGWVLKVVVKRYRIREERSKLNYAKRTVGCCWIHNSLLDSQSLSECLMFRLGFLNRTADVGGHA